MQSFREDPERLPHKRIAFLTGRTVSKFNFRERSLGMREAILCAQQELTDHVANHPARAAADVPAVEVITPRRD
jgi:hypothetical protein